MYLNGLGDFFSSVSCETRRGPDRMRTRIHMRDGTTWQTGTVFCSKDPAYAAIGTKPIGLQHSRLAAPPFFC